MIIDLDPIVQRLKNYCPGFEERVFKTIPDDELDIDRHESPVAFVYLQSDVASDNQRVGGIRQEVQQAVVVEIVVRRSATATDKFNSAASDILRSQREEVGAALIGWQPDGQERPILKSAGQLNKKEAKVLKWLESFSLTNFINTSVQR